MKSLFVVASEGGESVVYRTAATDDLLAKLDQARGMNNYSSYEDSEDLALALPNQVSIDAFTAVAGSVPLEKVSVDAFLEAMGADGLDCFF